MDILLDAHIFLWYANGDKKLKQNYKKLIEDQSNKVYLSVASIWECVIKFQIGKLQFPKDPSEYIPEQRKKHQIDSLNITESTIHSLETLPLIHKDPFDRIIISQSLDKNLKLITEDKLILNYKFPIFL